MRCMSTGRKNGLTLLEPQSRFGDKPLKKLIGLSPKWDCGPKRVNVKNTRNLTEAQQITLLELQSRFGDNWGQITWNLSALSPKRDCGSKGVKRVGVIYLRETEHPKHNQIYTPFDIGLRPQTGVILSVRVLPGGQLTTSRRLRPFPVRFDL